MTEKNTQESNNGCLNNIRQTLKAASYLTAFIAAFGAAGTSDAADQAKDAETRDAMNNTAKKTIYVCGGAALLAAALTKDKKGNYIIPEAYNDFMNALGAEEEKPNDGKKVARNPRGNEGNG